MRYNPWPRGQRIIIGWLSYFPRFADATASQPVSANWNRLTSIATFCITFFTSKTRQNYFAGRSNLLKRVFGWMLCSTRLICYYQNQAWFCDRRPTASLLHPLWNVCASSFRSFRDAVLRKRLRWTALAVRGYF